MESKMCGRCSLNKPEAQWNKSQWVRGGAWCKQCYREWHRERYVPATAYDDTQRPCIRCHISYTPQQRRASVYCSRRCKDDARSAYVRNQRAANKPERKCQQCGRVMRKNMRSDARFCSSECNARAHAAGRRKKVGDRDYVIARLVLHERDSGICAICGNSVDLALQWPDLQSASVDHILPLSMGGDHEDSNLRVVHLTCNSRRKAQMF